MGINEIAESNEARRLYALLRTFFPPFSVGTWTPAFAGTSTVGTFTYTVNTGGRYIRLGPLCLAFGRIQISAITGAPTGNITITGLPFVASSTAFANGGTVWGDISNFNYAANAVELQGLIQGGEQFIRLIEAFDNANSVSTPAANFTNANCSLFLTAIYEV